MASEKASRILKAKSTFSDTEIATMSDSDAWSWIYANAPQTRKPRSSLAQQIHFTGFSLSEKAELTNMAKSANLDVVNSVTKELAFLCAGENAGPAKLKKAQDQRCRVIGRAEFISLLTSGELPELETTGTGA